MLLRLLPTHARGHCRELVQFMAIENPLESLTPGPCDPFGERRRRQAAPAAEDVSEDAPGPPLGGLARGRALMIIRHLSSPTSMHS
jgi:hypothetical protein